MSPRLITILDWYVVPLVSAGAVLSTRWGKQNLAFAIAMPLFALVWRMWVLTRRRNRVPALTIAQDRAWRNWNALQIVACMVLMAFESMIAILAELKAEAPIGWEVCAGFYLGFLGISAGADAALARGLAGGAPVREPHFPDPGEEVPTENAVRIQLSEAPARSHFGGHPRLPPGAAWPTHEDRPLAFLMRVSLPELQRACEFDWLPRTGALLFFYDVQAQPWGLGPMDRGRGAVLHVTDVDARPPTEAPPRGVEQTLAPQFAHFQPVTSVPSSRNPKVRARRLSRATRAYLRRVRELRPFGPEHQIGGYPRADEREVTVRWVRLARAGVSSRGAFGPRLRGSDAATRDSSGLRLLLQLENDPRWGLKWLDSTALYFWIPEDAARRGDFREVWVTLF